MHSRWPVESHTRTSNIKLHWKYYYNNRFARARTHDNLYTKLYATDDGKTCAAPHWFRNKIVKLSTRKYVTRTAATTTAVGTERLINSSQASVRGSRFALQSGGEWESFFAMQRYHAIAGRRNWHRSYYYNFSIVNVFFFYLIINIQCIHTDLYGCCSTEAMFPALWFISKFFENRRKLFRH